MINLPIEVLAKCLVSDDYKTPIRNAVALRGVSSGFLKIVESEKFLLELIGFIDSSHPYLSLHERKWSSFKEGYFASQEAYTINCKKIVPNNNYFWMPNETGVLGIRRLGGIEVYLLGEEPFSLKELKDVKKILASDRSGKYFVITARQFDPVHIYTADGKKYLGEVEVQRGLRQMGLVDNMLYCADIDYRIFAIDLEAQKWELRELPMPKLPHEPYVEPYLFFKNHLICLQHGIRPKSLQFLSLSSPKKWVEVELEGVYFPFEEGVFVEKRNKSLEKITFFEDTFKKEPIGSLGIVEGTKAGTFNQRIFLKNEKLNEIYCYHALKDKTSTLQLEIPKGYVLSWAEAVADRVYAVLKNQNEAELMTIKYSPMQYLPYHA